MRAGTALRWTGGAWFLPALFALTCVLTAPGITPSGYSTADIADAGMNLGFAGPLLGAVAAWRFRGFTGFVAPLRSSRLGLAVVARAWWPLVLAAPVTFCAGVLVSARALPREGTAWSVLVVDGVVLVACAVLGMVLSWALPAVLAGPAILVLSFGWLNYTVASDHVLLYNMNSVLDGCCSTSEQPATGAVLAGIAVPGIAVLGPVLLVASVHWARRSWIVVTAVTMCALGAGLGVGAQIVHSMIDHPTFSPSEPRTTATRCFTQAAIDLCLWPEEASRGEQLGVLADRLNRSLVRWGEPPVARIDQRPGSDAVHVLLTADLSESEVVTNLADGYLSRAIGCNTFAEGPAYDQRIALLDLAMGLSGDEVGQVYDRETAAVAETRWKAARTAPASTGQWLIEDVPADACERL